MNTGVYAGLVHHAGASDSSDSSATTALVVGIPVGFVAAKLLGASALAFGVVALAASVAGWAWMFSRCFTLGDPAQSPPYCASAELASYTGLVAGAATIVSRLVLAAM